MCRLLARAIVDSIRASTSGSLVAEHVEDLVSALPLELRKFYVSYDTYQDLDSVRESVAKQPDFNLSAAQAAGYVPL